jgi:hypothetical protein
MTIYNLKHTIFREEKERKCRIESPDSIILIVISFLNGGHKDELHSNLTTILSVNIYLFLEKRFLIDLFTFIPNFTNFGYS